MATIAGNPDTGGTFTQPVPYSYGQAGYFAADGRPRNQHRRGPGRSWKWLVLLQPGLLAVPRNVLLTNLVLSETLFLNELLI